MPGSDKKWQSMAVGMKEACGPYSPAGAMGSPSWWSQGLKGWRGVLCREAVFPWRAPCPHTLRRRGSGGECLGLGHLSPAPFISFCLAESLWVFKPRSPDRIEAELTRERGDAPL